MITRESLDTIKSILKDQGVDDLRADMALLHISEVVDNVYMDGFREGLERMKEIHNKLVTDTFATKASEVY